MTELSYTIHGDYAIPNLKLSNPADKPIGKYGRMRKRYLQQHRPILYNYLNKVGKNIWPITLTICDFRANQ